MDVEKEYSEELFEFEDNDYEEKRRYLIVIIYDVTNNKRRYQLAKFLKSYGLRVQKSSFEGVMDRKKYDKLIKEIHHLVNPDSDLLRVYKLAGNAEIKTWGSVGETEIDDVLII